MATYYIKAESMKDALDKFKKYHIPSKKTSSPKKSKAKRDYEEEDFDEQLLEGEDFLNGYDKYNDTDDVDYSDSEIDVDNSASELPDDAPINDLLEKVLNNKELNVESATVIDDHTIECTGGAPVADDDDPSNAKWTITMSDDGKITTHATIKITETYDSIEDFE